MKNIRQRIRKIGIKCIPWKEIWRGEIKELPISSKTLFKKEGMPMDIWEMNLKSEGLLFENENLLEILKIESNLYRGYIKDIGSNENINFGLVSDEWTQEDYECNFNY